MHSEAEPTLDLTHAPAALFLFGLAGGGKSYVGNLIGRLAGWFVYHADDDLTDEMKLALAEHRPFTEPMRDRFFAIVIENILALQKQHPQLVVTQAVYKQRHRDLLAAQIPNLELVCVTATDTVIFQRIKKRDEGITIESAAALRADFQIPAPSCKVITNDGGTTDIIRQLNHYYAASN
jgi:gluconate kinase